MAEFRHVLISGASGLLGRRLQAVLKDRGHSVTVLSRDADMAGDGSVFWDPVAGRLDPGRIKGVDAVVNLAGENIAEGRWSEARKRRLLDSRILSTGLLAKTLAELTVKPEVLISVSGVNYYGDCGEEAADESSAPGKGFLADLCGEWEAAARPAEEAGIRVVYARLGPVLSSEGGMLAKLLPIFRAGGGGRVGSGRQYISWISIEDVIGGFLYAMESGKLSGPVNFVAPNPVRNREFAATLGRVLKRPAVFPVPAFALRLAYGEMAEEMLLSGVRVLPKKLNEAGFEFRHPELEGALREHLGKE